MSRVLIIEHDEKCRVELTGAILAINASNKIEAFVNSVEFETHCKSIPDDEITEFLKFDLVIFDYGSANPNDWKEKLAHYKNSVTGNTTYAFTAYDTVGVNRKFIHSLQAHNIFYKPFDPLILKESLNLALTAKKAAKPLEIQAQTSGGDAGILKEIELVSICELGFITMSDVTIATGSTSKYYSTMFSRGKRQSVYGQCLLSLQIPNRPGRFINKFHFVGLEAEGLNLIRRYVQANKINRASNNVWDLTEPKGHTSLQIGIIDVVDSDVRELITEIEAHFKNVKAEFVHFDPSKKSDVLLTQYHAVINRRSELKIDEMKKFFNADIPYFLILDGKLEEDAFKALQPHYRDIFSHPHDRGYFYKKLKLFLHDAEMHEPAELLNVSSSEKLKAANMVKINEICELYLNFNYQRPLEYGEFREFAFINDDENQIIELPAYCNFVAKEKSPEGKDVYNHQFIFWGMTDFYLKEIRLWLLKTYLIKTQKD